MNIKHHTRCRLCGNPNLTPIIDLGSMYFQGCFIQKGYESPPMRKMPNLIVRCDNKSYQVACGCVQTKHSVPEEILYRNYWYESGVSTTMVNHLKSIVDECCDLVDPIKCVLDIASNDNTLLRCYPSNIRKYGVDPSNIASKQTDEDITVINSIFPTKLLNHELSKIDIITTIACFYDVNNPYPFLQKIHRLLSDNGIWVFEVAYLPSILDNLSYDSFVNEHVIHYHLQPIEYILKKCGLKLFWARKTTTNGGSIMCYVCKESCNKYFTSDRDRDLRELRLKEFEQCLDEDATYATFCKRIQDVNHKLVSLLKEIKANGETVHIYGASTKLNTILGCNNIGPELIQFAAERSINKIGATTLSGIKIISEEESRKLKPDYYLVGPYHFEKEILEREKDSIKNGTKFIFPLPQLKIYGHNISE